MLSLTPLITVTAAVTHLHVCAVDGVQSYNKRHPCNGGFHVHHAGIKLASCQMHLPHTRMHAPPRPPPHAGPTFMLASCRMHLHMSMQWRSRYGVLGTKTRTLPCTACT
jgi:hypothetical protein